MIPLGKTLDLIGGAADAVGLVQDLLDSGDERQDNRRLRPKVVLIAVIILATLLFLLMSYLTSGLAGPGPAAAASAQDERTLATPHAAYFKDCAAARAARAAPLIESQTAYRPGLDDDGDGVACEGGETGLS